MAPLPHIELADSIPKKPAVKNFYAVWPKFVAIDLWRSGPNWTATMDQSHSAADTLTTPELRDREAKLLAQFRSAIVEAGELQEGYAFRLPGDGKWITLVAELIVAERECCPFLTFGLAALRNKGPLIVRVSGPPGAKDFVKTVLWKPTASS